MEIQTTSRSVELRPMPDSAFDDFYEQAMLSYAMEKIRSDGLTEEEARQAAKESFEKLLPDGFNTKDHYICSIFEEGSEHSVGYLWFAIREIPRGLQAYIYDFSIQPKYRGLGLGRKTLEAFESKVLDMGIHSIGLHVFGHNDHARRLYEKMGYIPTNIVMSKFLR